jgi:S1-C subfamily serine protease
MKPFDGLTALSRIEGLTAAVLVVFQAAMVFGQGSAPKAAALRNPVVDAVKTAAPAVVNISTEKIIALQTPDPRRTLFDDDLFDRFFEQYPKQNVRTRSLGSGVLVDRRGYIVTNEHVVRRASKIAVTLNDKSIYLGRLISADPSRDLAVIRISREAPFPTVNMNRREPLMIGETAIAVGNPFGFEHTVTVGVVSATGRNVSVQGEIMMRDLVQTDASINPGNSGGALLDVNGDLIGVNTAIRAGAEGIGFAIPVSELRKALVDLLDFRRLSKVWIGVGLAGLVNANTDEPVGLRVIQVQPDSPAQKSGLKYGDVITRLNGRRCVEVLEFEVDVLESRLGEELVFEGVRESGPFRAALRLERLPVADPNVIITKRLGLSVEKLSRADAVEVGLEPGTGVIVRSVAAKSPAASSGLKKDDVIVLFANFRVTDPEELASGLERIKPGDQAVVVLIRKGFKYYTWVRVN